MVGVASGDIGVIILSGRGHCWGSSTLTGAAVDQLDTLS